MPGYRRYDVMKLYENMCKFKNNCDNVGKNYLLNRGIRFNYQNDARSVDICVENIGQIQPCAFVYVNAVKVTVEEYCFERSYLFILILGLLCYYLDYYWEKDMSFRLGREKKIVFHVTNFF